METVDPTTGETIESYELWNAAQAHARAASAREAFQSWKKTAFTTRAEKMQNLATLLEKRAPEYARLMAREMGKPLRDGISEAEKCAWVCRYYAENAAGFLAREIIKTDARKSFVSYQPLGPVLAVMPWNFPFWQVFRFLAPALMAGNTGLLKHAANVAGCARAIEEVVRDAGFPENCFINFPIDHSTAAALIEGSDVAAVTLTGSTRAGQSVAATAGRKKKKTVLELGGSDAYIVLADADLEASVKTCVQSRLINGGQSCIAAKRFIVERELYHDFVAAFVERMRAIRMGSPFEDQSDIGPMARHDLRDELHKQVERTIEAGARLCLGGELPEGPGAFYPPTVLADVEPGMAAFDEELFGPVAPISCATDAEHALTLANQSEFGLGAAIFTSDLERGEALAEKSVEAGSVFVNSFVKSDPRLPFGGIRGSGYGRELSFFGIREFVNIKTIYVA